MSTMMAMMAMANDPWSSGMAGGCGCGGGWEDPTQSWGDAWGGWGGAWGKGGKGDLASQAVVNGESCGERVLMNVNG
jgi:hypothetical protein